MKRLLLWMGAAIAALTITVSAQTIFIGAGGGLGPVEIQVDGLSRLILDKNGRITPGATGYGYATAGATPTVANVGANSCGTTAATIAGNPNTGEVTVGATSGTQCRITVPAAPVRWNGSCSNTVTGNLCRLVGVSTTTFDIVGTFVAADVVTYTAFPR